MNTPIYVRRLTAGIGFLLLLALPWWTGCEEASLNAPEFQEVQNSDSTLFESYAAIGNSITAGFQSGGIDSTTQHQSFAIILADSMHTPFGVPEFVPPGCPPPLTSFFNEQGFPDPQRPGSATTCGLRDPQIPPHVNNVAVPGATVIDVLTNRSPPGSPNPLTQLILGGRTQLEAAMDVNPTFATVWIGNNNVLSPALNGTADVTSLGNFASSYTNILAPLSGSSHFEGGVLVGVANVLFAPYFSPGPVYYTLDQQQPSPFPSNFDVAASCNDRDPTTGLSPRVPLEYGFTLLGRAQQTSQTVTLDCQAADTPVLTLNEVNTIAQTVQQYNAFIQNEAQQRGLAYFNPNEIFRVLYTNDDGDQDPTNDLIPKFPDRDSEEPFGQFFSLDGIHPSAATHRIVAAQLTQTINEAYNTTLNPPSDLPSIPTGQEQ